MAKRGKQESMKTTEASRKKIQEIMRSKIIKRVSKSYLYTYALSSIINNSQKEKQPKCPLIDEWIIKMWSTHTTEYYSALKRNYDTCYNIVES